MLIDQRGDKYIKIKYIHVDHHRRAVTANSEELSELSGEYRPTLGVLGKSLVAAMASITKLKLSSVKINVYLRVSDEMYAAEHVKRNPHHHAEPKIKETATETFTHEIYPLVSLKSDPYRHAIDRAKILHAVYSHADHTPAEVLLAGLDGNSTLKILGLERNGLSDVYCESFLHIFKNMKIWTSLEHIKLGDNPGIGQQGGLKLIELHRYVPRGQNVIKIDLQGTKFFEQLTNLEEQQKFEEKFSVLLEKEREQERQKKSIRAEKLKRRHLIKDFLKNDLISRVLKTSTKLAYNKLRKREIIYGNGHMSYALNDV